MSKLFAELVEYASEIIGSFLQFLDILEIHLDFTMRLVMFILVFAPIGGIIYNLISRQRREMLDECDEIFTAQCPATPAQIRQANDALRAMFGTKHFVSLKQYRSLIEKNNYVLTAIINDKGEMVGYFDIFPLVDSFGELMISGAATELEMGPESEYDKGSGSASQYIYIGAIFNFEHQNAARRHAISYYLQRHIITHIFTLYPPRKGRKYLALASSEQGAQLLKSYKFSHMQDKKDRRDKCDLYLLEYDKIRGTLQKIYQRFGDIYHSLDEAGVMEPKVSQPESISTSYVSFWLDKKLKKNHQL